MSLKKQKGLVLMFHCVPYSEAPEIEEFWGILRQQLNNAEMELFLVSTALISDQNLSHIQVPFMIEEYSPAPDDLLSRQAFPSHYLIDGLCHWYNMSRQTAAQSLNNVWSFYASLIEASQPALVVSWQSMHPVSRILREICLWRGIPWWSCERGWVRETLMLDVGENNFLTELRTSLALSRIFDSYQPNPKILEQYITKTKGLKSIERYSTNICSGEKGNLRNKWGIPAGRKVFAFFTHGEPHVGTIPGLYGLQRQHELSPGQLIEKVNELSFFLAERGDFLVVKEHPFNIRFNNTLKIDKRANVVLVDEPAGEILEIADHLLFTLSTLQFEAALLGKSFGLLCRGLLSGAGEAPLISEFESVSDFVEQIENENIWNHRRAAIQKRISYMLEHFLLDLDHAHREASARTLASHLVQFRGLEQDLALPKLIAWLNLHRA